MAETELNFTHKGVIIDIEDGKEVKILAVLAGTKSLWITPNGTRYSKVNGESIDPDDFGRLDLRSITRIR